MIEYVDLDRLLVQVQAEISAAGCHGFLCGQICAFAINDKELWIEYMDVQSNDDDLVLSVYKEIQLLSTDVSEQLQSGEFDFQIILPDNDDSITEVVEALADWCHGFLNGFGLGAAENKLAMNEDCQEVIKDISEISRVGTEQEIQRWSQSMQDNRGVPSTRVTGSQSSDNHMENSSRSERSNFFI